VINFTDKPMGTEQSDNDLPAYGACVLCLCNDEVRTLGQGTRWMHGPLDALAQDASNRSGNVVRHNQRSVWMSPSASPSLGRQMVCRGPFGATRFSVVKTPSILCIVRSLGVILA
jgi:hypothetical protein